jgi:hypothetical protein
LPAAASAKVGGGDGGLAARPSRIGQESSGLHLSAVKIPVLVRGIRGSWFKLPASVFAFLAFRF